MSNQAIEKLLEKLDKALDGDWGGLLMTFKKKDHAEIKQALAELRKQPKCETCGGSKRVPALWGMTQMHSSEALSGKTKPCPDCKQPESGEFTKNIKEKYGRGVVRTYLQAVHDLYEACTRLDAQAGEIGRLRAATGLLNSMVLSGEKHSDESRKVVKKALKP